MYIEDYGVSAPLQEDGPVGSLGHEYSAYDPEGGSQSWDDSPKKLALENGVG